MYGPKAKRAAFRYIQSILNTKEKMKLDKMVAEIVTLFWLNEETIKKLIGYQVALDRCYIEDGIVHSLVCYKINNKK